MTARRLRVVFAGDESTGSLAAVRALGSAGYEPWLAVSQPRTYAARSRAIGGLIRLDASDPERYSEELARQALRIRAAAVLPGTEASLHALTGREHLFDGVPVGTTRPEVLERATDKSLLAELSARAGLATARMAVVRLADLDAQAADLDFPAIVKPQRSIQWHTDGEFVRTGARRVDSRLELRDVLAEASQERWVVERLVRGRLASVAGVAWEGEVLCTLHQLSPRTFPSEIGTSSYAVTVEPDPARDAGVRHLIQSIGWSGIFGVQFLLADEGAYVIDLNPRVYGSVGLAVAAGHNLPAIWTQALLGDRPSPPKYRRGVGYRAEEDDFRVLAAMLLRGPRRDALRGLLPRSNTTHGIFALRDPLPALVSLEKLVASVSRGRG